MGMLKTKSYEMISQTNDVKIEIGDSKDSIVFQPQVKLMKWDNEVNFSLRLETTVAQNPTEKDGIISTENVKFYEVDNGYEIDIELKEKPKTNVIRFSMNGKTISFAYQPIELSKWEIEHNCNRPDEYKGSYVIYHANPPINVEGGKVYGTGQIGVIRRPQMIDSKGNKVWGSLTIIDGFLEVIIPQDFIDKASYPIRKAAGLTIGYETAGTSTLGVVANRYYGGLVELAEASGDISKLTASIFAGSINLKAMIAKTSDGQIITNGIGDATANSPTWTQHWQDLPYTSKPKFGASEYGIGIIADNSVNLYYNAVGGEYVLYDTSNSYSSPTDPTDGTSANGYAVSCYATYVAAPAGNTTDFFMFF